MQQLTIQVSKSELLAKLKENKERFVKSFNRLLKAYDKKAAKYQEKYAVFVQKVKEQKLSKDELQPNPPVEPKNQRKTYDFYIGMLRKHNLPTVELSEECFRMLWNDQWTWIRSHIMALKAYVNEDASVEEALSWYAVEE